MADLSLADKESLNGKESIKRKHYTNLCIWRSINITAKGKPYMVRCIKCCVCNMAVCSVSLPLSLCVCVCVFVSLYIFTEHMFYNISVSFILTCFHWGSCYWSREVFVYAGMRWDYNVQSERGWDVMKDLFLWFQWNYRRNTDHQVALYCGWCLYCNLSVERARVCVSVCVRARARDWTRSNQKGI